MFLKMMLKWMKFFGYLCAIGALEQSIDNTVRKCHNFKENTKDPVILDYLEDIECRMSFSRIRTLNIRDRIKNLYDEGKMG